ncbi:hypothetical protein [Hymenobacter metallicola]|uniref:LamG domain-containing protein n=1 Tax=Hymenobacter metallicola TaxID=2563114 RepID=A0A4Z0QL65_9BACT|nr:hypothetical protein [Hymenobacter metallicola]TGE29791.1 hypothetical protein E5K02_10130 [Hymenobacter metallicola]
MAFTPAPSIPFTVPGTTAGTLRVRPVGGTAVATAAVPATGGGGNPSIDPDAQTYLTNAGFADTGGHAWDAFFKGLKSAGIYPKLKAAYPIGGSTALSHSLNMVNPLNTDAAYRLTFPNGAVHGNSVMSFDQSGNGQYAETHLNVSELDPDNFALAFNTPSAISESASEIAAVLSNGQLVELQAFFNGSAFFEAGPATQGQAVASSAGLTVGNRPETRHDIYKNGSLLGGGQVSALPGITFTGSDFKLGSRNNNQFSDKVFTGAYFFSQALSAAEIQNFTTLVQNLDTALGR